MDEKEIVSAYAEALVKDAKTLSNQDFNFLLNSLLEEQKQRKEVEASRDWKNVCKAIKYFTDKHGSLFIQEGNNPLIIEGINILPGKYDTDEFGVITVKY